MGGLDCDKRQLQQALIFNEKRTPSYSTLFEEMGEIVYKIEEEDFK